MKLQSGKEMWCFGWQIYDTILCGRTVRSELLEYNPLSCSLEAGLLPYPWVVPIHCNGVCWKELPNGLCPMFMGEAAIF